MQQVVTKIVSGFKKFFFKRKNAILKKKSTAMIKRIDENLIPDDRNEIRLFAIMRNESLRLPFFLKYYNSMQVSRFFLIDNNSTDSSLGIALKEKNVHLFSTPDNYENHWYWMEYLLEKFGKNHWCIVVDIDELFSYPYADIFSLKKLINFLEQKKETALLTILLDMYSDKRIIDTPCKMGENPLEHLCYFDRDYIKETTTYFDRLKFEPFASLTYKGGMRSRVFEGSINTYSISKVPLFKNVKGIYLTQGMHSINGARLSKIHGVVFHTKFMSDFIEEVAIESEREQHYDKAKHYKYMNRYLANNPDICLWHKDSVKFTSLNQLIEMELMQSTEEFNMLIYQ